MCALLRLMRALLTALLLFGLPAAAQAALSFNLRTGSGTSNTQAIVIDSNQCPNAGPTSAYVGGMITNSGATTATGITATMSGFNANIYLAGGQATTQALGSLNPGESIAVFWFVGVSCVDGATASTTISLSSSAGTQNTGVGLTTKHAISANAGGRVIGSLLGPGAIVGQTIFFDADYEFGGSAIGDEFLLQPAGGQTFNAACFRLVGSEITASNVTGVPAGTEDQLYFLQTAKQTGNGYTISVRYFFEYLCANASTTARPYAVQTSGTQLKYTGNFDGTGSISLSFPGATNPFTITKTVSEDTAFTGSLGNLTYTVTITNPSAHDAILSGMVDTLPAGMSFVGLTAGSDVQVANSSAIPASGATGTLTFTGKLGQSYAIGAGGTVTLEYTVARPPVAGTFVNSANGYFGLATTATAQASYIQVDPVPLGVTKLSFAFSDPVNGAVDPKAIPGAVMEYSVHVTNPNPAALDADSVVVTDNAPDQAAMCLADIGGAGPLVFVDGGTSSALSYSYAGLSDLADDLEFSDDEGLTWDYVPQPDGGGCDSAITNIRVRPDGEFAASSSFTLRFRFRVL